MLMGHDERNTALLNLIPTQERLPEGMLRLERTSFSPNSKPVQIVCVGVPGIGIPRGSDNDFLVALINAYIDSGCPEDGIITTSAYSLLKLAGLRTGGQYYLALAQGLERMLNTTFHVTEGWFDVRERRYTTVSFRIIDNLTYTHAQAGEGRVVLDRRSALKIRLNDEITKSIKAGYIKQLDLEMYQSLPSIGSRALYRYLDVYLHEASDRGERKPYRLSFDMLALAGNTGLLGKRTDHLHKALETMCAPLLQRGYLKRVDFVGRGRKTTVHFTYGESEMGSTVNPEHVALLTKYGVYPDQAKKYVRNLGDAVLLAVEKLEERRRKGERIGNQGAYLASILKQESGLLAEARVKAQQTTEIQRTRQVTQAAREAKTRTETAQQQLFEDTRLAKLQSSDLQEALEVALNAFKAKQLERRGLSLRELDQLRALVLEGRVPASYLDNMVTRALLSIEGLEALRALL